MRLHWAKETIYDVIMLVLVVMLAITLTQIRASLSTGQGWRYEHDQKMDEALRLLKNLPPCEVHHDTADPT